MHRKLKLQHHRHTGKVLAHQHTSYRALAVILLVAGFVIIGAQWCLKQPVGADTLNVYASVPAPIPTDPSTITDPADGSTSTVAVIDVRGNCQIMTPAVTVAIYDNGVLKGSAPCETNGTYSAQITLVSGSNTLIARTVTITGDNGPDSAPSQVTYLPPVTPPTGQPGTSPGHTGNPSKPDPGQANQQLGITSSQSFILMDANKGIVWTGLFSGGRPPYEVKIDWGDNTTDVYHNVDNLEHGYMHTYRTHEPRSITITVTDRDGNEVKATISVMSAYAPPPVGGSLIPGSPSDTTNGTAVSPGTVVGIYGAYLILITSVGFLWLHAHAAGYAYAYQGSRPSTRKINGTRRKR